jgi:hypothetical protein
MQRVRRRVATAKDWRPRGTGGRVSLQAGSGTSADGGSGGAVVLRGGPKSVAAGGRAGLGGNVELYGGFFLAPAAASCSAAVGGSTNNVGGGVVITSGHGVATSSGSF